MKELEIRKSKEIERGKMVIVVSEADAPTFTEFITKVATKVMPDNMTVPVSLPGMLSFITIGDMLTILKKAGEGPKCEQCKGTGICSQCAGKGKNCKLCQGTGKCIHCNGTGQANEPIIVENKESTPAQQQTGEIRQKIEEIRDDDIVDAEVVRQRLNKLASGL